MRLFLIRGKLLLAATCAALLLTLLPYAPPASAYDVALPGCIVNVQPGTLSIRTSGVVLPISTTDFRNPNGHRIAVDECYLFLVRKDPGRLVLESFDPEQEVVRIDEPDDKEEDKR